MNHVVDVQLHYLENIYLPNRGAKNLILLWPSAVLERLGGRGRYDPAAAATYLADNPDPTRARLQKPKWPLLLARNLAALWNREEHGSECNVEMILIPICWNGVWRMVGVDLRRFSFFWFDVKVCTACPVRLRLFQIQQPSQQERKGIHILSKIADFGLASSLSCDCQR